MVCSAGIVRLAGIRVTVHGTPPAAPFFLVTNHISFLDVFVLASKLGCVFVSRGDLRNWPVFGFMSHQMNTIFIDRERMRDTVRVNELIASVLTEGHGIVVFPEGGVSQENRVLPFKAALLDAPARLGIPIHYGVIHYATLPGDPPASAVAIWRDGVTFLQHYFAFATLRRVDAVITFAPNPIAGVDRKQLASALHDAVSALYEPLV